MGQVTVFVHGKVRAGDYLIASGRGDGIAVAVSPPDLTLDQVARIVGRAWSEAAGPGLGAVNVGIGLETNELVGVFAGHQERIDRLKEELASLEK